MTPPEAIAIIGAAATFITALAQLVVALRNRQRLEDVHGLVNGQMTALLATARQASFLQGKGAGLAQREAEDKTTPPS